MPIPRLVQRRAQTQIDLGITLAPGADTEPQMVIAGHCHYLLADTDGEQAGTPDADEHPAVCETARRVLESKRAQQLVKEWNDEVTSGEDPLRFVQRFVW